MPLVHGLGSYIASRGEHWDGVLGASDAFFSCRENTVSQKFERRLAAIEYKVKRQELHREDIRDLVDLTASRMDMYHLVGALLLSASIAWLADSSFTESYLPSEASWFTNVLFVSNISAVGFLVLCVWFAMYATLASKSIGTRLLVNYARLSLPTADELSKIKAPIFFNAGDSLERNFRRCSSEPDLRTCAEEQTPSEDANQHLRRFLEELPKWLVYDMWSRVCLSFGTLQMLQAMSYFALGVFWPAPNQPPDQWFLAVFAFCAVRSFTILMFWVDFSDLQPTTCDYIFMVSMEILGPALCIDILSEATLGVANFDNYMGSKETYWIVWASSVFIIFAAHAAEMAFVAFRFDVAPIPGCGHMQHDFQPVNFSHVLEWVPDKPEQKPATTVPDKPEQKPATTGGSASLASKIIACFGRCAAQGAHQGARVSLERRGTRIRQEIETEARSKRNVINGGHEPGTWMSYQQEEGNVLRDDLDECKSTDWLPVRATRIFCIIMIVWWLTAGVVHTVFAEIETIEFFRSYPEGPSQPLNTSEVTYGSRFLSRDRGGFQTVAMLQWPNPFFKVTSLYCSDSRIWVSDGFSVFALMQNASQASKRAQANASSALALALVAEGHVGAIFCHENPQGCQSLRRNTSYKQSNPPWFMDILSQPKGFQSRTTTTPRIKTWMLHRPAVHIPVPSSWRLLAAAWTSCTRESDFECGSVSLAGWDGAAIFIAVLRKDDSSGLPWTVHTQFEVDPRRAVCADGSAGCHAHGATSYTDVNALQLTGGGDVLTVLRSGGLVDEWTLSRRTLKRLQLDEDYTAMCRSGERIFLSRDTDTGPMIVTTAVRVHDESKRSGVESIGTGADEDNEDKHPERCFLHAGGMCRNFSFR